MNNDNNDAPTGAKANVCDALGVAESALEHALLAVRAARSQAGVPAHETLTLGDITSMYGYGGDAIKAAIARGELEGTRGPRSRIEVRRSELERWRASKPAVVRPRKRKADNVVSLEQWEAETDRRLATGGRR